MLVALIMEIRFLAARLFIDIGNTTVVEHGQKHCFCKVVVLYRFQHVIGRYLIALLLHLKQSIVTIHIHLHVVLGKTVASPNEAVHEW